MKLIEKFDYVFSKDLEPVERVKPGETIRFKTLDCFSNQVCSNEQLITSIDFDRINPGTGPIYIEGAEVGDTLVVKIDDIQVNNQGVTSTLPDIGPLTENVETRTKVLQVKDGKIKFNDVEIDARPMIGVIGVAPKDEAIPCGSAGDHGGNMDNKNIVKGTTLYFPVFNEGALLQIGDLHAVMGDGELAGTGLEIAGEVTVTVDLIKNKAINRPIHETEDKYYTIASASEYEEAVKLASLDMQELITEKYGWDNTDAYLYLTLQGDIEVCQSARPSGWPIIVRLAVPKIEGKPLI